LPRLARGALLAGLLAAAGGCGSTSAVFLDAQSDHLRDRTVLVVDSAPQPPLKEERQRAVVDTMEQRLQKLPHLKAAITRQQFLQVTQGNFGARDAYQVYSDTLSVVGVSDRELALALRAATGADLLFNVQAYFVPCAYCADGDAAYLVSQFVEAATGKLLLRVDLRVHPGPSEQALGEAFAALEEESLDILESAFTPRLHIERFRNLKRLRAGGGAG
jgi:hypothetical protein